MPQHWRCSNGHAWTGDLGALTYCPDCGSADVYEVRPQYESLLPAPAADASDRTYVQLTTANPAPPSAGNVGDTSVQAPVISANVGDTLTQPAVNIGDTFCQPAGPGTTLVQAYVPDDGATLIQAPALGNGDDASGETLLQSPRTRKDDSTLDLPVGDAGGTIHQSAAPAMTDDGPTLLAPRSQPASNETRLYQAPMDGGSAPAFTADAPTLDAPDGGGLHSPVAGYLSTMDVDQSPRAKTPGLSGQDTRLASPSPARGRDGRTGGPPPVEGYEILGILGRGGMGVVYKARQVKLNRIVALKMILAGGHAGAYERQRFITEANAVAALQHPNIVQIYETGERDGLPYFSLEFCDGGSLQQKLGGQPMPPKIAADVAEQLSRAMQYAHERGIVHRDLKPANILFAGEEASAAREKAAPSKDSKVTSKNAKTLPKGAHESRDANKDTAPSRSSQSKTVKSHTSSRGGPSTASIRASQVMPKVTDFGLAKRLEEDSGLTGSGTILGTPSYMAPEQAAGESRLVGPPADIHALGAILYEMLTGRPPFLGENVVETMNQVRTMDPVPPTRIQPKTPKDLETVCLKCLQKEIHKRYGTAGDLADDLRRFLDGEPIAARPVPVWEKGWKWAKRQPAQAALIAMSAAVLIAAAVGGVAFGRYQSKQAAEETRLKQKAIDEYQRAEANFQSAREAVDSLLVRVGAERLEYIPKAEKLRKELLEQSLTFYDRFLTSHGNDPAVQREAGWAYQRVGRIRNDLGDRKAAIAAYLKAVALFASLANDTTGHQIDDKFDLAQTRRQLAVVFEADNRPAEGDAAYEAARAGLRELADENADRLAYRAQLADLFLNRGGQFYNRRRLPEAEDAFRQALAEYALLCRADPSAANRFSQGKAQANLGAVIFVAGRSETAIIELRKAVDELTAVVNESPGEPEAVKERGQATFNLANAYFKSGKNADADRTYQQSIQQLVKLVDDFPKAQDYRFALALAYDNYAVFLKLNGGLRAAEPKRQKARAIYEQLRRDVPENNDYRLRYALDMDEHAIYLAENDQLDAAITDEKISVELLSGLVAAEPLNSDLGGIVRENARRHLNLGQLYARNRQKDDAETEYALAAGLLESAANRRLKGDESWFDLPDVYMNQAKLLQELNRGKAAERTVRQAVDFSQRIVAAHPDQPDAIASLASAESNLASLPTIKPAESLKLIRQAVNRQRAALTLAPKRTDLMVNLGLYGGRYLTHLVDEGDHATAATTAANLANDLTAWPGLPLLAAQLSRCVRLARTDKSLSDDQKTKLSTSYGEQALDLLRKAVAAGFKNSAALKESTELEVLRTDPQFERKFTEILAQIDAKNKK